MKEEQTLWSQEASGLRTRRARTNVAGARSSARLIGELGTAAAVVVVFLEENAARKYLGDGQLHDI